MPENPKNINGDGFDLQQALKSLSSEYSGRLSDLLGFGHLGLSDVILCRAKLDGIPVVIKIGEDIGHKEKAGIRRLRRLLPVLENLQAGRNYIIYPDTEAKGGFNFHFSVIDPTQESAPAIADYVGMHSRMWKRTLTRSPSEHPVGYIGKIDQTKKHIENMSLEPYGIPFSVGELINNHAVLVTNGITVDSMQSVFDLMRKKIVEAYGSVAMTHGDEGLGNCLFRLSDQIRKAYSLVMIDSSDAGYRSPYESIAKILAWFDVIETNALDYNLGIKDNRLFINTQTVLKPHIYQAIEFMRRELNFWLNSKKKLETASAFLMMYYLREIRYAEKRGRQEIIPYLLSKALSFTPALYDGTLALFPLQKRPKNIHYPIIVEGEKVQTTEGAEFVITEKKPHKVIRLNNEKQLSAMLPEIAGRLRNLRLITFDLDNTLLGPGLIFPKEGLLELRNQVMTAISSGAGYKSIERKIRAELGQSPRKNSISHYFSGPVITEDGARIIRPQVNAQSLDLHDILDESAISDEGISMIQTFIREMEGMFLFCGFYPESKFETTLEEQYSPFEYIFYIPDGDKAEQIHSDLKGKYGENIRLITDLQEFLTLFQKLKATKFVFKPNSDESLEKILQRVGESDAIAGTKNEGYINLVNRGVNKQSAVYYLSIMLMELEGLEDGQVAHFGNDLNDLPALLSGLSFLVDSDKANTARVLAEINRVKKEGITVVVTPDLLDKLLELISKTLLR